MPGKFTNQKMSESDRIEKALFTVAKYVALYGDVYLPVFERLHTELSIIRSKNDLKQLALKMSQTA